VTTSLRVWLLVMRSSILETNFGAILHHLPDVGSKLVEEVNPGVAANR
jgi:hypothetical protein